MTPGIPPGRGVRVIGDVHGDAAAFRLAAQTGLFVVQLGDLVDEGPDSAGALGVMFDLIDAGDGLFILGNHDFKLARALGGAQVQIGPALSATLAGLDAPTRARASAEIGRAPAWLRWGTAFFVHAGFHTAMLDHPSPCGPARRADGVLARALFGEPTGRRQADGFPERSLGWVDRIPPGLVVYCGHDRRSRDGRPWTLEGAAGGRAVFLDTGAGKGGHLSWIDLPAQG